VEEALDIKEEYYLGLINDRASQQNMLMVSRMGGVDIEQVAEENPEAIVKQGIDAGFGISDFEVREACYGARLNKESVAVAAGFVKALYRAFVENDCTLAEINPLVLTGSGKLIAADAKMNIDDNALFRHPDLALMAEVGSDLHPLEKVAQERKIAYVHLDGEIGIIGNGAGLVMGTMDEVKRAGGNPANFLDVGGGAQAEEVRSSVELVLMDKNVKGLLFNIFGGITRCDEVANGLKDALATMEINVPIVVRLTGTREEEGRAILETIPGLHPAPTMQEAAKKIVELAYAK
jgi:succinyl-CoA synthetase beta subunit